MKKNLTTKIINSAGALITVGFIMLILISMAGCSKANPPSGARIPSSTEVKDRNTNMYFLVNYKNEYYTSYGQVKMDFIPDAQYSTFLQASTRIDSIGDSITDIKISVIHAYQFVYTIYNMGDVDAQIHLSKKGSGLTGSYTKQHSVTTTIYQNPDISLFGGSAHAPDYSGFIIDSSSFECNITIEGFSDTDSAFAEGNFQGNFSPTIYPHIKKPFSGIFRIHKY